jgi:ribosome recycling factor
VYASRQCRWKHNRAARRGNHLEKLDDLAHASRRQEADERKNKKRDKSRSGSAATDDETDQKSPKKSDGVDSLNSEPRLPDVATVRKEMEQIYQLFLESLKGIRGAEPTPDLFDRIMVNAYGGQVPLSTVAQVVIVNPTLATATCFDPSLAKSVAVAIRDKLDLNAAVDEDDSVRIPVPRPTLESRRKLSQQVHERGEACRKRIRNVRRSAMDVVKQGLVGKLEGVSKDEAFRASQTLESITDDTVKKVTAVEKDKQQSIMDV